MASSDGRMTVARKESSDIISQRWVPLLCRNMDYFCNYYNYYNLFTNEMEPVSGRRAP